MDADYQKAVVKQGLLDQSASRLSKEGQVEAMLVGQQVPAVLS